MQQVFLFVAGLGMFLYAMHLLEDSLKAIAGRTFKVFLRKHTDNTVKAIVSSAIVTGILQSSSVVIMTILAFVGAGIVSMRNALAVSIGSHFGTTLDSWLVASVGFKMDVSVIALPLVGVACIVLGFIDNKRKIFQVARLLLGFGLLFLGLEYMKDSISELLKDFDFTRFENYPRIAFVGIGFLITSLIQSSSATMAILLSALNTGAIPFETAVAAVIGSEFGAMTKVFLGGFTGIAAKRQLAAGNIIFNLVICTIAFVFLDPFIAFTAMVVGENEILLQLVLFQSIINLIGVFIFAPFLSPFTRLLEKHIRGDERRSSFVVDKKLLRLPSMAGDALEQDGELLIHRILRLNLEAFATERRLIHHTPAINETLEERNRKLKTYEDKYEDLKKAEGEILIYALQLTEEYPGQSKRIGSIVAAVRHAMHSAKAMKDVRHNRIEFHESADDIKFRHYVDFRKQLEAFYEDLDQRLKANRTSASFVDLIDTALQQYQGRRDKVYDAAIREKLGAEDVSSLLNVNRELYTSCKTIAQALQLYYAYDPGKEIGEIP